MLVELRMKDEEQRSKQLILPTPAGKPHAAAAEYDAESWTWIAQEWEEYEAEAAGAPKRGQQSQNKPKLCSAYASKDGCPKGAMCV
eukprot:279454-Amphidinium_carterae.1